MGQIIAFIYAEMLKATGLLNVLVDLNCQKSLLTMKKLDTYSASYFAVQFFPEVGICDTSRSMYDVNL